MQQITFGPWFKYSKCDNDLCLQARWGKSSQHSVVQVRDSALDDASPVLTFDPASWAEFLNGPLVR